MHVLFIALAVAIGVVAYLQIGRLLGWYCYRTWHNHLSFVQTGVTCADYKWVRKDGLTFSRTFWFLFPEASLKLQSEIKIGPRPGCIVSGTDDDSGIRPYQLTMMLCWPIKIVWTAVFWSLVLPWMALRFVLKSPQRVFKATKAIMAIGNRLEREAECGNQETRVKVAEDARPAKIRELETLEKRERELADELTSVRAQTDELRGAIEVEQGPAMRSAPLTAKRMDHE